MGGLFPKSDESKPTDSDTDASNSQKDWSDSSFTSSIHLVTGNIPNADAKSVEDEHPVEAPSHRDREQARRRIEEALGQLRKGKAFEAVSKEFSDGDVGVDGCWQRRVALTDLADAKTVAALRQMAEGEFSPVIETKHSFRIVRLVSRTPAGFKTFDEAEDLIGEALKRERQRKALEELHSRAIVESPYIDDLSAIWKMPAGK